MLIKILLLGLLVNFIISLMGIGYEIPIVNRLENKKSELKDELFRNSKSSLLISDLVIWIPYYKVVELLEYFDDNYIIIKVEQLENDIRELKRRL